MTEHDPRAVEELATAVQNECGEYMSLALTGGRACIVDSKRIACMILSREAALVAALERIANGTTFSAAMDAYTTLAAHRASRQPSEPSLAEAVECAANKAQDFELSVLVPRGVWLGVKAALAREQAKP